MYVFTRAQKRENRVSRVWYTRQHRVLRCCSRNRRPSKLQHCVGLPPT